MPVVNRWWDTTFANELDQVLSAGGIVLIGDDHSSAAAFNLANNLIVNTTNHNGKCLCVELSGPRAMTNQETLAEFETWSSGHPGGTDYDSMRAMLNRADKSGWSLRGVDILNPRMERSVQARRQRTIASNIYGYHTASTGVIVPYGSGHLKGVGQLYGGLHTYLATANPPGVVQYDVDASSLALPQPMNRIRVVTIDVSCVTQAPT